MQIKALTCGIFGVLLCMLTGCGLLAPDYHKPSVDLPNHWESVTYASTTPSLPTAKSISAQDNAKSVSKNSTQDANVHHWWWQLNDKTLNILVENGITRNNDLQEAIANIKVAAGNLQQIKMGFVPTINLGASYGVANFYTNSIPSVASTIPQLNTNNISYNYYSLGLVPSYSLNIFAQIDKVKAAQANLAITKANTEAVRLAVISQIVGAYLTYYGQIAKQEALKAQIIDLKELCQLVHVQHERGLVSNQVVDDCNSRLLQAQMNLPSLQNNIIVTMNALAVLTSTNSDKLQTLLQQNTQQQAQNKQQQDNLQQLGSNQGLFATLNFDNARLIGMPSAVLNARPDIIASEEQLKMANANIGVARANFFPHITLISAPGTYNADFSNLFNVGGNFWQNQITATMPILNLGLYGLIKQARGAYYVAYYNYIKTVENAFAEVNNHLSNYAAANKTYTEALHYDQVNERDYLLNDTNYRNGYSSYPQLLTSRANLEAVRLVLIDAKLAKLEALVQLYQSLAL